MSIEKVRIKLKPFDFESISEEISDSAHPLNPIYQTDGLIFLITPTVSENTTVNYSSSAMVHSNEEFSTYQNTNSRVITLSDIKFPCDTYENARYALAALHFFRSYTHMAYGTGETGRPPSPMWFSGYGDFMFKNVPCLYGGYDFSISNTEQDLVQIANPDSYAEYAQKVETASTNDLLSDIAAFRTLQHGATNWLPTIFSMGSITLRVQHTPNYWKSEFSLKDFRSGGLLND